VSPTGAEEPKAAFNDLIFFMIIITFYTSKIFVGWNILKF
jgi:hypothetical protein